MGEEDKEMEAKRPSKEYVVEETTRFVEIQGRAAIVRNQIIDALTILENIQLTTGISDTSFRDYIEGAKRKLRFALNDFTMSSEYWRERIDDLHKQLK